MAKDLRDQVAILIRETTAAELLVGLKFGPQKFVRNIDYLRYSA